MLKSLLKPSLLVLALIASQASQAANLSADGSWQAFDVDNLIASSGNLEWIDLDGNALSFDFTLSQAAYLRVVDGGFAGDRFQIFDHGNLLGITSEASQSYPTSLGLDFDAAWANAAYSQGTFLLSAGSHSITGWLSTSALDDLSSPINATVGAVSLTAVPVPAAAWLYLTGASLLGALSRRKHLV